jgi:hypothetical protein
LEPENLSFGGGVTQTFINPIVLVVVLICGILICILPRNKAIVPFLAVSILIPTDQVLLVAGLHFPMLRILALFGLVRILWSKFSKKEVIFSGGINGIDKAVIVLTIFTLINGFLLWQQSAALINQFGNLYTVFGVYFLLRFLVRDEEDVKQTIRVFACVALVVAVIMIVEQATGRNPYFAALGGAQASQYKMAIERDDHLRARGVFAHPILAGTFGGFMAPLFVGLWWRSKTDRKYAVLGIFSAIVMPLAASSSTALFGFLGGLIGLAFWPLRRRMRIIRWAICLTLISLHLVMKAPVWHLISRVDLSGGSSSFHRYQLVNECITHFWDWVLVGTKDYASWGFDMWDLSNQYVGIADTAGLIPLTAFFAILVFGFGYLGIARARSEANRNEELFTWAIGASLFANVVAFWGIGYFDQIIVGWYSLLAIISAVTLPARNTETEVVPAKIAKPSLIANTFVHAAGTTTKGGTKKRPVEPRIRTTF